jgi:hypothetical protein
MRDNASITYAPINTLKRVAEDVWIVDGPVIRFGWPWPKFRFSTRMTVVRLASGELFLHSPTQLTGTLQSEIARLGSVRFIVGPNRVHYWWIPEWKDAFPDADVYFAPRIREQARGRIPFEGLPLAADAGYPWGTEMATLPIPGSYMTEVEFFHRASRTLVLTDLLANPEPGKVNRLLLLLLKSIGGISPPHGGVSRDLRLNFTWRHRHELEAAVQTMLSWEPERIIFAHGRWHDANGTTELRNAFRWLLK